MSLNLSAIILSGFVAAALAPWLHGLLKEKTGWLLAAYAAVLTGYFASFIPMVSHGEIHECFIPWFPSMGINFSFYVDGLGLLMALLITGIGALITLYASSYLHGDGNLGRFYMSLMMFMASMLGVVLADNLLVLFIFWELTSVSSYLLIGYKHEEAGSRKAALQALLVTGAGGLALLAGVVSIYVVTGTYEMSTLLETPDILRESPYYGVIFTLVLLGAFTKSAQTPFHFWLPSAMAAPTPVSAYLHSATMVKAGVFLLAHMRPLLGDTFAWFLVLTLFGGLTLLTGGWLALVQTDLKRILAYSTVATLGLLVFLLGIDTQEAVAAALTFLMAHAMYKAALFLIAGIVDHETGTRDVRLLGKLWKLMPYTAGAAALAGLSNAGSPFLFGFIAKEYAYEAALHAPTGATALTSVAVAGNICLVAVGVLVGFLPFWAKAKGQPPKHPHEAPFAMWIAPMVLGVASLITGCAPWLVDKSLLLPATIASWGGEAHFYLNIWHGLTFALFLSTVTVTIGVVFAFGRSYFEKLKAKMGPSADNLGPAHMYDMVYNAIVSFSKWQTRMQQSGYQRHYIMALFMGTGALILLSFLRLGISYWPWPGDGIPPLPFYEVFLVVIMLGALLLVVTTKSRMTAIMGLGVIGYGVSLIFTFYSAPDLAITQILVETLTLILIMVVVYRLPQFQNYSTTAKRIQDGIFSCIFGIIMTLLIIKANTYQFREPISEYFAETSKVEAHGQNVVNVILVDFRALDTMGEITVLAVAALGVWALLRFTWGGKKPS